MVYNRHHMKYFFALLLASMLIAPATHAQTEITKQNTSGTPTAIFDVSPTGTSLETRKEVTTKNLQELSTWLSTMLLRVHLATNRLTTNGIDTTNATAEIASAQEALTLAKKELSLFIATPVDAKPETLVTLRTHAKNTEDALKKAKTHISGSLLSLQLALQTQ